MASCLFRAMENLPARAAVATLEDEPLTLKKCQYMFAAEAIRLALEKHNGVKAFAAADLGMNRTTLVEKCKLFGIAGFE